MAAGAAAAGMTAGKFAAQLGAQVGADAVSKTTNTLIDRMFAKRDRKINWKESERYGKRNMQWAKDMAQFNENVSMRLAEHDQRMAKDYFDYTLEQDSPAQQMKRLKEAGLNPALMYEGGNAGATGQTGGASADPVRANAAEENYKPIAMAGSPAMAMRETPAERELKLAQAENLRSQVTEREGIGKSLIQAKIDEITEGISGSKARTALTNAQTYATELKTKLDEATFQDQSDIVEWTAKKVKTEYDIAMDEAYVSRETRDQKIEILKQTLINSIIESSLKRATIKHIGKTDEEIDANIKNIANIIQDRINDWRLKEKNFNLDTLKYNLDVQAQQFKEEYPAMSQYIGKILDQSTLSIFNATGLVYRILGIDKEGWK